MCDNVETHKKGISKSWIDDLGGAVFSGLVLRANSKNHAALCTKRHAENFKEITRQEWSDILPVLKNTISKIERVNKTIGFLISIPVGQLGNQNSPHFYMRIIPKYKEDWGETGGIMGSPATPEMAEKIRKALQTKLLLKLTNWLLDYTKKLEQ